MPGDSWQRHFRGAATKGDGICGAGRRRVKPLSRGGQNPCPNRRLEQILTEPSTGGCLGKRRNFFRPHHIPCCSNNEAFYCGFYSSEADCPSNRFARGSKRKLLSSPAGPMMIRQSNRNKYPPAKPGVFLRRAKPSGTSGTRHVALVRSANCESLLFAARKRA